MCGSSHGNLLRRLRVRLAGVGFADASFGFGFLMGATPGTGVVLLSILMAAGLKDMKRVVLFVLFMAVYSPTGVI